MSLSGTSTNVDNISHWYSFLDLDENIWSLTEENQQWFYLQGEFLNYLFHIFLEIKLFKEFLICH